MKCIIIDDHKLSREILEKYISRFDELEIINQFDNPIAAIGFLKSNDVDLIFLDVEMPEMTGMEFISYLNGKLPKIILTTSHTEFAIEAFKYNVSGYLVKPIKFDEFRIAIEKVFSESNSERIIDSVKENVIFLKEGKTITKINTQEIKLIECVGDYVSLFTNDKKYIIHSSMKTMESRFSQQEYMRVHRSYIVRIDAIDDIEDDTIAIGKKLIPIGKTHRSSVYKRLNIF